MNLFLRTSTNNYAKKRHKKDTSIHYPQNSRSEKLISDENIIYNWNWVDRTMFCRIQSVFNSRFSDALFCF